MENDNECVVEDYLCERVDALGGGHRKLTYIGRRGCSDQLIGLNGELFIVETKRPKGGIISIHQSKDAEYWAQRGIAKVYLHTVEAVDQWTKKVFNL